MPKSWWISKTCALCKIGIGAGMGLDMGASLAPKSDDMERPRAWRAPVTAPVSKKSSWSRIIASRAIRSRTAAWCSARMERNMASKMKTETKRYLGGNRERYL